VPVSQSISKAVMYSYLCTKERGTSKSSKFGFISKVHCSMNAQRAGGTLEDANAGGVDRQRATRTAKLYVLRAWFIAVRTGPRAVCTYCKTYRLMESAAR